ncbi:SDR family NAD(P)-dependent oxidoreductase [Deinococcus yunweiensis]|uniref:SDR family NAD(P)-dependent oxidoreductase n=1 Tax=Deinococcus yunweiensis TaxID=367282 RepID=UPI00398EDEE7
MARIFITGSADGLGHLTARALVEAGHQVVLHARSAARAHDAMQRVPDAAHVVVGDLSDVDAVKSVADEANALLPFDAVIHNAGVYRASPQELWTVNVLAPYILTCRMRRPARLIYLSSDMHLGGRTALPTGSGGVTRVSYADSKLAVTMLCRAVARRWPAVAANAVDPGWVPTKLGGAGAPDDLQQGIETQVWLATSGEAAAGTSGGYFRHQVQRPVNPQVNDPGLQERFLSLCGDMTGVTFPPAEVAGA